MVVWDEHMDACPLSVQSMQLPSTRQNLVCILVQGMDTATSSASGYGHRHGSGCWSGVVGHGVKWMHLHRPSNTRQSWRTRTMTCEASVHSCKKLP